MQIKPTRTPRWFRTSAVVELLAASALCPAMFAFRVCESKNKIANVSIGWKTGYWKIKPVTTTTNHNMLQRKCEKWRLERVVHMQMLIWAQHYKAPLSIVAFRVAIEDFPKASTCADALTRNKKNHNELRVSVKNLLARIWPTKQTTLLGSSLCNGQF